MVIRPFFSLQVITHNFFTLGFSVKSRTLVIERLSTRIMQQESLIVDEGIIQSIWGMYRKRELNIKNSNSCKLLLSLISPLIQEVIIIKVDRKIIKQRLNSREKKDHLKNMSDHEFDLAYKWFEECALHIQALNLSIKEIENI